MITKSTDDIGLPFLQFLQNFSRVGSKINDAISCHWSREQLFWAIVIFVIFRTIILGRDASRTFTVSGSRPS
jgi:hypothetical protein